MDRQQLPHAVRTSRPLGGPARDAQLQRPSPFRPRGGRRNSSLAAATCAAGGRACTSRLPDHVIEAGVDETHRPSRCDRMAPPASGPRHSAHLEDVGEVGVEHEGEVDRHRRRRVAAQPQPQMQPGRRNAQARAGGRCRGGPRCGRRRRDPDWSGRPRRPTLSSAHARRQKERAPSVQSHREAGEIAGARW